MTLQTWVARFVVDQGKVTEEGGRLRTFQRRRLDEPDVDLHVLAEPSGEKGEDLGAQALEAIGRSFLQDRLSLTGGMMRAIQSTNQTLLDWNRRSVAREQVSAGLVAAVVSGATVFLAQTGPGLLYLRQGGKLQRLEQQEGAHVPLGEGEIEPDLRRIELQPGDLILAASTSLERILGSEVLEEMLQRGHEEALPELYLLTRDEPHFALFAITCFEGAEEEPPQLEEDLRPPGQAAGVQPPVESAAKPPPAPEPAESRPEVPAGLRPAPEALAPVLMTPRPLDISRPVVRLRNNPQGRADYPRTTGAAPTLRLNIEPRLLAILGVVGALLLIGFLVVPNLVSQDRSAKVIELVNKAQDQLGSAASASDPAQRRAGLENARLLATEALRLDPSNPTASEVRQQAATSLNNMDAITNLGNLNSLTTLSKQLTGQVSVAAMLVENGSAYLLDAGGGRIVSVFVNSPQAPSVIYQSGESYTGTQAKKPLYFSWQGDEKSGRLLILDADRKLFAWQPGAAPKPLPLRRTGSWASVAGIAASDDNLYVLDPKGGVVLRYLPSSDGFDSEPTTAVSSQRDLSQAQGLAIVEGDILVYVKDGLLQRFRNGSDIGFSLAGIDHAPKTIGSLGYLPATKEVYLVDSSSKRIVVAGADGVFRRQYVSNAFTDLRAVGTDTAATQLYAVVGDALLSAPLPH